MEDMGELMNNIRAFAVLSNKNNIKRKKFSTNLQIYYRTDSNSSDFFMHVHNL